MAFSIETSDLACENHRPIIVVLDVLLAGPNHLDGPINLLGNENRDPPPVLGQAAPAKTAAEMMLVDSHFRRIDSERRGDIAKCAFPVLSRRPNLRASPRYMRRAGHRLHGRMCEIGDLVISPNDCDPARQGLVDISDSAADGDVASVKTTRECLSDRLRREAFTGCGIPGDRERVACLLCLPPRVRDDRHGSALDRNNIPYPGHVHDFRGIEAL